MNLNKYTEKAQEAILTAQKMAEEKFNTQIEVEHLLAALIDQRGGVVPQILSKLGVNTGSIRQRLEGELQRLPRAQSATQPYLSQGLRQVLDAAESEAERL